jgi:integrase
MPYFDKKSQKWRACRMIAGQRKSKLFQTKKEAKEWEVQQNEEEWAKETIPTTSCLEWATEYLDMAKGRFATKTYKEKQAVLKAFLKAVDPEMPAERTSPQDALRYLGHQARERSGHAANKDRKNLMAAWSWGKKYLGLPKENPFDVERYPEERKARYIPPPEDMETILANETGETRTFLLAMLHTAARRGELLRLKWGDVDFHQGTIRLSTRKRQGGSLEHDQIPMTEELCQELKKHRSKVHLRSLYVFSNEEGNPYTNRQHLMKRICKRNRVTYFGFHAIRHLSASIMDRASVPTSTIQAILRHKSRTTTDRYLHQLRGVRADLNGVFGKKDGRLIKMGGE